MGRIPGNTMSWDSLRSWDCIGAGRRKWLPGETHYHEHCRHPCVRIHTGNKQPINWPAGSTFVCISTVAPAFSRASTTTSWPSLIAIISAGHAVRPSWRERENNNSSSLTWMWTQCCQQQHNIPWAPVSHQLVGRKYSMKFKTVVSHSVLCFQTSPIAWWYTEKQLHTLQHFPL